jgi:hypothetical protein
MRLGKKRMTAMTDKIRLTLYLDCLPAWIAFIHGGDGYKTEHREQMESWLLARGLTQEQMDQLFRDVEENGEAIITLSTPDNPPDKRPFNS